MVSFSEPAPHLRLAARPQSGRRGRRLDRSIRRAGFTLLEVVCALAIVALLVAIVFPAMPRETSRARLEAYAFEAAALLKSDRTAAIRSGARVVTAIDPKSRLVLSGASRRLLRVPDDVSFAALLASGCDRRAEGAAIEFFPSGMSCGGTLSLSRPGVTFEVRVAWLTGGVEVVSTKTF